MPLASPHTSEDHSPLSSIEIIYEAKKEAALQELSEYNEDDYQRDIATLADWHGTIILHGLSGSGRTTQLGFFEKKPGFTRIIAHTNRDLRPGETNGKEVILQTTEEIEQLYAAGGNVFIERYPDGRMYFYTFPDTTSTTYLTDPTQVGPEMKQKLPKSLIVWFDIPFSDAVHRAFDRRGDKIDAILTRTSAPSLHYNVINHENRDLEILGTLKPEEVHRLLVKRIAEKIDK